MQRYRASIAGILVVVVIGVWPDALALLARAYIALCERYLVFVAAPHHAPPLIVAALAPVAISGLFWSVAMSARQYRNQRRLDRRATERCFIPDDARAIAWRLGIQDRVRFVDDRTVYAFCAGLLAPRIYLSRGLIELLAPDEIEAVLRHEREHLVRRDPLRFFLADLAGPLAAFVPLTRWLVDRFHIQAELRADRAALVTVEVETLAGAMVKVMRATTIVTRPAGIAGLSPTDARVAALLGRPVDIRLDRRDTVVSAVFVVVLAVTLASLAGHPVAMPVVCDPCFVL